MQMIFYETETIIAVASLSISGLYSAYCFLVKQKYQQGLVFLLCTALLIRLLMSLLDPFLHAWDERYHALVAKHVMETPFMPRLFPVHIMPFDPRDWGYNHIWVHKQPVFLWQMALAMKIFGVNLVAMRLPSVLMGTMMVWLTYDIGSRWTSNRQIGFIAAFFIAFGSYGLELVSGRLSLDHNDMAFAFYITASVWAFTRYAQSANTCKWAVLIGLFAGLAIMNKWLTGLVIFGSWFVYFLMASSKEKWTIAKQGLLGLMVCVIVFLPWQLYTLSKFPVETQITHQYNALHFSDPIGHPGTLWSHFGFMEDAYHGGLMVLCFIGIITLLVNKVNRKVTISLLSLVFTIVLFFTLAVATKMPSYTYPIVSIFYIVAASGMYFTISFIKRKFNFSKRVYDYVIIAVMIVFGFLTFRPGYISSYRSAANDTRNTQIANARIYEQIDSTVSADRVVLNCRSYQNINLMFHSHVLAYHYYPGPAMLDSLQKAGHVFAAFDYPCDHQELPTYIMNDTAITILNHFVYQ